MDPISSSPQQPVIDIHDPVLVEKDGQRTLRTTFEFDEDDETLVHHVDVSLKDGEEHPGFERQIKALNVGIDQFHKEIRESMMEEDREDPIRET